MLEELYYFKLGLRNCYWNQENIFNTEIQDSHIENSEVHKNILNINFFAADTVFRIFLFDTLLFIPILNPSHCACKMYMIFIKLLSYWYTIIY